MQKAIVEIDAWKQGAVSDVSSFEVHIMHAAHMSRGLLGTGVIVQTAHSLLSTLVSELNLEKIHLYSVNYLQKQFPFSF